MDRSRAVYAGGRAKVFLPCLVMAILLMAPLGPVQAQSGPSSQSRSSRDQFDWNGPVNVTLNTSSSYNPFITVHPNGDLIVVYNREPNEVRWARMDANHTLLSSDNLLATVNSSLWYMQPTVLVDSKETIHFFWKDLYGGTTVFYKHMSIDKNGQVSHYFNWDFHCIPTFVDGNDYFWCLKLEGHPSAGSPVQNQAYIRRSNEWGNIVMVADVGHNNLDNPAGAVAQGPNNKIYTAYLGMQGTSINFSVVDKDGNILVEPRDQINETGIKNITLVVGTNGTAHIFYARDEPGQMSGDHSIHHVAMSKEGALLYNHTIVSVEMPDFAFIAAAGPDPSGNILVVDGYFPPIDPWEQGTEYFTTFVGTNGIVARSREPLTTGCPSRFGTAAMNSSGGYVFVNQDRGCNVGGGGPGVDMTSDVQLYYTGPVTNLVYDVEIVKDSINFTSPVMVEDLWNVTVKVRNNGPDGCHGVNWKVYFTHNGTLFADSMLSFTVPYIDENLSVFWKFHEPGTWNITLELVPTDVWDTNMSNNKVIIAVEVGARSDIRIVNITVYPSVPRLKLLADVTVTIESTGLNGTHDLFITPMMSSPINREHLLGLSNYTIPWTPLVKGPQVITATLSNIMSPEAPGKDGDNVFNLTVIVEDQTFMNQFPNVTIDNPKPSAKVSGLTKIEGVFSDPDGDPVTLVIFEDGSGLFLAPTINGDRYAFDMDFSGQPEGEHWIKVQACDDEAFCTDANIKLFVSNTPTIPPNRPPSISGWSPQGWALTLGCGITSGIISITVQDPEMDLLKVQWHIDGDNDRTDYNVVPGSSLTYSLLESNLTIGQHNVTVNVGDALSLVTMTFNVTVRDPASCGGGGGGGGDQNDTPPQPSTETVMNTPAWIILVMVMMIVILASAIFIWRKRTKGQDHDQGQFPQSPPQYQSPNPPPHPLPPRQQYYRSPPPSRPPRTRVNVNARQKNRR